MKRSFADFVIFFSIAVIFQCSPQKHSNIARITIEASSKKSSEVSLSQTDMLNLQQTPIAKTKLDSVGNGVLEFSISKKTFVTLEMGNISHTLYIEPGYDLKILLKGDSIARYFGIGAEPNTYLFNINAMALKIMESSGRNISSLEGAEFNDNIDSLEKFFNEFHRAYLDSITLDAQIADLFDKTNRMRILQIRQAREWNYGVAHNFEIPKDLQTSDKIPSDSVSLASRMWEYAFLLDMNMQLKLHVALKESKSLAEDLEKEGSMALAVRDEIKGRGYLPFMKEFLLAKNADFWMSELGFIPEVTSLYSEFKNQYPKSGYLNSLEDRYSRSVATSPGHKAPEIKGITPSGDSVSSADFINKVVYIDVWASWCGPCRAEIPSSEKLQAVFKTDEIIFLNSSVDEDTSDWKNALTKYPNWKGVHILTDRSIYKTYNISGGIPRYILIDKQGQIVDTDAPRPSSRELESEIRTLLN